MPGQMLFWPYISIVQNCLTTLQCLTGTCMAQYKLICKLLCMPIWRINGVFFHAFATIVYPLHTQQSSLECWVKSHAYQVYSGSQRVHTSVETIACNLSSTPHAPSCISTTITHCSEQQRKELTEDSICSSACLPLYLYGHFMVLFVIQIKLLVDQGA